ncbi:hypothetical protein FA15DRAFT_676321 [Coprinopsis marcescibilis]|uniref:Uncharacterized protein n=1 Tax=Coprinopsis marcescibilis TaxID=230819 RepID=A0A5C3KAI3_COPMA|nr:hypothetical protein FA15DRAFT_676321 [Coprinopsis marcescibilis]
MKPELVKFLSTNDRPDESLVVYSKEWLRKVNLELSILNEQMKALQLKHSQLSETRNEYLIITSSSRLLPAEIIAEILKAALPPSHVPFSRQDRLEFRRFRSICRLWRIVAFSTPCLWSRLMIKFSAEEVEAPTADPLSQHTLYHWFQRAGPNTPLTLCVVDGRSPRLEEYSESVDRLAKSILFTASTADMRWQTLEFIFPQSEAHLILPPLSQELSNPEIYSPWASVRSLRLTLPADGLNPFSGIWSCGNEWFAQALPSLETLRLGWDMGLLADVEPGAIITHPKVKTLEITFFAPPSIHIPHEALAVIKGLPSLNVLKITRSPATTVYADSDHFQGTDQMTTHPKISYLTLHCALECLQYFNFPAATRLAVEGAPPLDATPILPFMRRSPNIAVLALAKSPGFAASDPHTLAHLVSLNPGLTFLSLPNCRVLSLLEKTNDITFLLPNIAHLSFDRVSLPDLPLISQFFRRRNERAKEEGHGMGNQVSLKEKKLHVFLVGQFAQNSREFLDCKKQLHTLGIVVQLRGSNKRLGF